MSSWPQVEAIARRSLVRTARQPAMVIPPLVFPVALMAVNAAGLQSSTELAGFPTDSFLAFALAVPFIQGALFSTMNAGTELARDVQTGFINRLSLTALRDWALLSGTLAGIVALGIFQAVFYIVVGLVSGVEFAAGPLGIVVLLVYAAVVSLSFGMLGAFLAFRTGSGEVDSGALPGAFRLPLHLVDERAARAHRRRLVPDRRDAEPGLVHDRVRPQPDHRGLGRAGALPRLRHGDRARRDLAAARDACPSDPNDEDVVQAYWNVVSGVAWRTLKNALTNPQIVIPTMAFPLFFFTAFAGGLSQLREIPGFDFPPGYTAFQFVFVMLQAAAFGGVFTGFGVARDFEGGFAKRLLLAAPHRSGIVLGYALAALVRWALVAVVLTIVAFAVGMQIGGSVVELAGLYGLALLVNFCGFFWAGGIAMRFRSIQAAPLMQMPVFLVLFFAPVYVPLELLEGWIEAVASVNPITYLLETGRGFVAGDAPHVLGAFALAIGLGIVFWVWAFLGLRNAEAAGA